MMHMRTTRQRSKDVCHLLLLGVLLMAGAAAPLAAAPDDHLVYVGRLGHGGEAYVLHPLGVAISPDGGHVYASCAGGLSAFARNPDDGLLTFVEVQLGGVGFFSDGLFTPNPFDVEVSPDGKHVYSPTGDGVNIFGRNATTGALTLIGTVEDGVGGVDGMNGSNAFVVTPDGAHLYVAGYLDNAVAAFSRDPMTGQLSFVEVERDGVGGVDGLAAAHDLAISPDGNHLYVLGLNDDAVAVFARNPGTGGLTFVEVQRNGVGGVVGLDNARSVAVSPDGANVYTSGQDSRHGVHPQLHHRAAHLPRSARGRFRRRSRDRRYGWEVAVAPDGNHVYVAASLKLATFRRAAGTGALTQVDLQDDLKNGVRGIAGNFSVAVSPDSRHIYTQGEFNSEVGLFRPLTVECATSPLAGCRQPVESGKATLLLKAPGTPEQQVLTWKWKKGSATLVSDFGDPVTTLNDYALCIYDQAAAPQPRVAAVVPAGAGCTDTGAKVCWNQSATGFKYGDLARSPDGVTHARLKAGAAGRAQVVVKAKGENIPAPPLPFTLPVVVQMQAANGQCWEATYSTPKRNDAFRFDAKGD